jgi:serine/threonine protein kinase
MVARRPLPGTWAPGSLIPGTVYRVIRPIGQGGMGEVYEVEHDMLGTRRALKVLVRHYAGREDLAERLRVEARGLARLKHPNLVEVYDLGTAADGRIFFAMELLDGVTLRAMLRDRGRLSVRTSVELVIQVLAGLQAAHTAGILHRDVKPENVFVCRDGTVKLLDFGVAKAIDAWLPDQQITARGMTVGTPRYMSPEQAEGGAVDGRTDVYATGQVLWEMLAGRPAFEETDLYELAQAKWRGVTLLSDLPGVEAPPALCAAVDQACQANPKNRFASAAAFLQALRLALVEADTPLAPGPSSTQAYLAHASEAAPDPTADTAFDPRGARSPNALVSGAVASELTERVEAVSPVNRDALTQAHRQGLVPRGPGGTEVLPAIARQVAQRAAPSTPPTRSASPPAQKKSKAKRRASLLGIPVMSWFAGASAFFVPVFVATAIGYWQFRTPRSQTPPADTLAPVSAPEPASEPPAEPTANASSERVAVDASAPAASSVAAPASASTAPVPTATTPPPVATPKTTRTSKGDSTAKATGAPPPSTPGPAPTFTRKMPGSGL